MYKFIISLIILLSCSVVKADTLVGTTTTTNETVIGTTTTTTTGNPTITTQDVTTQDAPEVGDTLIETQQTTTTPVIENTYENVQVDTTTTNTYQTGTTSTQSVTENLITPGSNTYHTVNICSQTGVSCSGQVINNTGYGSGGGWGVEFGYAGGTVSVNRDLEDYLSGVEGNVTITQGGQIRLNCSNRIGGSGCNPTSPTNDHIIMTLRATDSAGNSVTQTRDVTGYWTDFRSYNNVLVFNSNNSADWNIQSSYYGRDYGYWGPLGSEWFGPNIDNLTLTAQATEVTSTVSYYSTSSTSTSYIDRLINSVVTGYNTLVETISSTVIGCEDKSPPTCEAQEALESVGTATTETETLINTAVATLDTSTNIEEVSFETTIDTNLESNLTIKETDTNTDVETSAPNIQTEVMSTPTNETAGGSSEVNTETETKTEEVTNDNTSTTTEVASTDNASSEKSETTETVSNESSVDKDSETEGSEKTEDSSETVENEETTNDENTDVADNGSSDVKTETKEVSIESKVEKIIAKVEKEIKNVGDKVRVIQQVKLQGMAASGADIKSYQNKPFYKDKGLNGIPNPEFFNQINISQEQIYKNSNLSGYTSNDPIRKQQAAEYEIEQEITDIIIQLEELKRKG